ncbi:MAG: ABC transporter substrate-binding protein [Gudongella sp.]|nr:ABC transporter substrate-binding protein [Gudongella sp.]
MKKILAVVLTLILVLSFAGCTPTEAPVEAPAEAPAEEPMEEAAPVEVVELEFWHAMADSNGEALQAIVDKFNAENPSIKINAYFQGHYKDLFEKLSGSAQAGNLPTLSMIYCNRLTAYVMNDLVEELDPYIFDDEIGIDEAIWNDIPQGLRDNGMWDNKHYSLPFNKGSYLMFYNVDALEEAGISVPTTWDQLREAAEILSKDGKKAVAFNASAGIDFSFWVEQAGGHIYDDSTDTILINTPETKKAIEFVTGLVNDGLGQIAYEDGYITGPISRGESFIGFASSSNLPAMEEACAASGVNWAVAELLEGEKKAALFSGTDITMFNTSTEEQKKAAWEFMKFWYESDVTAQWGSESGYIPMTSAGVQSPIFQEYLASNPSKLVATNQLSVSFQDPKALNAYAIHSNMQEALDQIVAGTKTVDEALEEAQIGARAEMDEAMNNFGQ